MGLFHYNGVVRNGGEDPVYIGGAGRVVLIDGNVMNLFEGQVRSFIERVLSTLTSCTP